MTRRLTPDQARAVESVLGDFVISAGAGSGKTTVLASRFARALLGDEGVGACEADIERILTITFTSKAAAEVAERVRREVIEKVSPRLGRRIEDAWISTIHTLCGRLVRRHALEAGVEPGFSQADDVEARLLQAEAFESAAKALYLRDADATALLDAYPYDTIMSAALRIHDQVRAMGLDPRDLMVPTGIDQVESAVGVALECTAGVVDALAACNQTPAVAKARDAIARYRDAALVCELGESPECDKLLSVADGLGLDMRGISDQSAKAAIVDLRAANDEVRRAVLGVLAASLLHGLEKLVGSFADEYRALKAERGVMDFDDLQEKAADLLAGHPMIARRYREHFKMIMIDEFQDTNELQMRVLGPLRNDDFCVVGDERQSIYGFRYADTDIFRRVRNDIGAVVELKDNFRSHAQILDFLNAAFSRSELFGGGFMRLVPRRTEGWVVPMTDDEPRVRVALVDTRDASAEAGRLTEAALIAEQAALLRDRGVRPADMALLLRSASNVAKYVSALEAEGFAVEVSAGQQFFDAPEVDEVVSLLRTVALPTDDEALIALLASRFVRLSDDGLLALRTFVGRTGVLYDALRAAGMGSEPGPLLDTPDAGAAAHAYRSIEWLREVQGEIGLGELIRRGAEAFDYDLTLYAGGDDGVRAWANVLKIARFGEAFEMAESSDPGAFVEHLRVKARETKSEPTAPARSGAHAVQVMTIHGSKGLEFPVVFVGDLGVEITRAAPSVLVGRHETKTGTVPVAGVQLPGAEPYCGLGTCEHQRLKLERASAEAEEEKRCLYVACTRAKELLVVSGACDIGKAPKPRFIIDWVRGVLGNPQVSRSIEVGGSRVEVTVAPAATPDTCAEAEAAQGGGATFVPIDLPDPRLSEGTPPCPRSVSYSQVHLHEQCPFAYYVRYILGMRSVGGAGQESVAFGSAVHAALQQAGARGVNDDLVGALARRYSLGGDAVARLRTAVDAFVASPTAARAFRAERSDREAPLRVGLGETALVGNIDLIAWEGDRALIVDYKTGKAPDAHSTRMPAYELQAQCYALSALKAGASRVEVRFCFIEHDSSTIGFDFVPRDAETIEATLRSRAEAMAAGPYPHLERFDVECCGECPALGGICPIDDVRPKVGR